DVTEQKEAEKELNEHRRNLEKQVEKRTSELKAMVDAMAHRVVRMSDLEILVKKLKNQIRSAGLTPIGDPGTDSSHKK
ncbi:MAG: hypothetical protein U9N73_00490, partial [Candidatus Auribacterota bacterium]|nr:hypothetical protein [Candidatus Auribacterota bacterium]